jgi:hypothetical protein
MIIFVRAKTTAASDGSGARHMAGAPRGNGDVSLQDHHRPLSSRLESANQKTEAKIACSALNRMTGLGMPVSVRIK